MKKTLIHMWALFPCLFLELCAELGIFCAHCRRCLGVIRMSPASLITSLHSSNDIWWQKLLSYRSLTAEWPFIKTKAANESQNFNLLDQESQKFDGIGRSGPCCRCMYLYYCKLYSVTILTMRSSKSRCAFVINFVCWLMYFSIKILH